MMPVAASWWYSNYQFNEGRTGNVLYNQYSGDIYIILDNSCLNAQESIYQEIILLPFTALKPSRRMLYNRNIVSLIFVAISGI